MAAKKKITRAKQTKPKIPARAAKTPKPAAKKRAKPKIKLETPLHNYYVLISEGVTEISDEAPKLSEATTGFGTFEAAKSHAIDNLITTIEYLEAQLWATKRATSFEQYQESSLQLFFDL